MAARRSLAGGDSFLLKMSVFQGLSCPVDSRNWQSQDSPVAIKNPFNPKEKQNGRNI
jgi:hypothetical protein